MRRPFGKSRSETLSWQRIWRGCGTTGRDEAGLMVGNVEAEGMG